MHLLRISFFDEAAFLVLGRSRVLLSYKTKTKVKKKSFFLKKKKYIYLKKFEKKLLPVLDPRESYSAISKIKEMWYTMLKQPSYERNSNNWFLFICYMYSLSAYPCHPFTNYFPGYFS